MEFRIAQGLWEKLWDDGKRSGIVGKERGLWEKIRGCKESCLSVRTIIGIV
jgi:hypothetical protein